MLNQCYYLHTLSSPSFVVALTEYMSVGYLGIERRHDSKHSKGHCGQDHTRAGL